MPTIVIVTSYTVTTPPNVGGQTTVTVPLVAAATVGNQLFVRVGIRGSSFPFVSNVTDDGSTPNNYLNPIYWDGTHIAVELWDADVVNACSNVDVVMFGGTPLDSVAVRIVEVNGASTAVDQTASNDLTAAGGNPD